MNPEEIKALMVEKRDAMEALLKQAEDDKRSDLNEKEEERYNTLDKEYDVLEKRLARAEKLAKRTEDQTRVVRSYTPPADPEVKDDLSDGEKRDLNKYSMVRAMRSLLNGETLTGVEAEMHEEGVKEMRDAGCPRQGNFVVPQIVLTRSGSVGSFERRDMTATGTTSTAGDQGGQMIQTSVGSIIERLRSKLVLASLGVRQLGGLTGNIDFPKFVENDVAAERSEVAAAAESSPTLTTVSTSPKRLPVFVEFTRQLVMQTSPDVEAMLRDDLAYQVAKVMDQRGINGSGSSNQPTGILGTAGIGAVVGGTNGLAPTWGHIVDLETQVAIDDADMGRLAYLTNPKVRGKLKQTFVDDSSNAERVWNTRGGNPLNEYAAGVTNLVPSDLDKGTSTGVCSGIIFGNFDDAVMAQWGGLEFMVNPYSRDTEGIIRLNCWTFYDFFVRRAQSFAAMQDALTT